MTHYPDKMMAVLTTGTGGYDKLVYQQVDVPALQDGHILLKVLAAGVNNTEINTRLGWYSSSVTTSTDALSFDQNEDSQDIADGGWNEATPFPIIQGTDCCGEVAFIGAGVDQALLGKRVLVRACMRVTDFRSLENKWMASDFNGAFADYVLVPASEVFVVDCDWRNEELATIPCAYATAETMLERTGCQKGDHVFVVGGSGGVGSAVIQLAKRRGAHIGTITAQEKIEAVRQIGADEVVARGTDLVSHFGENSFDIVIDNVGGQGFGSMLKILKRGGKLASSGAIAGPVVALDMRDMYLKDITLFGSTAWDEAVFPNLISYIENKEIKPLLAKTFALKDIAKAQEEFSQKSHIGNFVLVP